MSFHLINYTITSITSFFSSGKHTRVVSHVPRDLLKPWMRIFEDHKYIQHGPTISSSSLRQRHRGTLLTSPVPTFVRHVAHSLVLRIPIRLGHLTSPALYVFGLFAFCNCHGKWAFTTRHDRTWCRIIEWKHKKNTIKSSGDAMMNWW